MFLLDILNEHGAAHAAANAECGDAPLDTPPLHLVNQGDQVKAGQSLVEIG